MRLYTGKAGKGQGLIGGFRPQEAAPPDNGLASIRALR